MPVGPEEDQGAPEGDGGVRRERALVAAVFLVGQVSEERDAVDTGQKDTSRQRTMCPFTG